MSEQNKYHQFTLNAQAPDQYGNTYNGTFTTRDGRKFWMNAKDKNGANGPFISGYVGKEKQPNAPAPAPAPAKSAEKDEFDDDIPF